MEKWEALAVDIVQAALGDMGAIPSELRGAVVCAAEMLAVWGSTEAARWLGVSMLAACAAFDDESAG